MRGHPRDRYRAARRAGRYSVRVSSEGLETRDKVNKRSRSNPSGVGMAVPGAWAVGTPALDII
jgi:hypothetical protein